MPNVFVIAIVILAIVIVMSTIKVVPQGRQWTVERFGRYTTDAAAGHLVPHPVCRSASAGVCR